MSTEGNFTSRALIENRSCHLSFILGPDLRERVSHLEQLGNLRKNFPASPASPASKVSQGVVRGHDNPFMASVINSKNSTPATNHGRVPYSSLQSKIERKRSTTVQNVVSTPWVVNSLIFVCGKSNTLFDFGPGTLHKALERDD